MQITSFGREHCKSAAFKTAFCGVVCSLKPYEDRWAVLAYYTSINLCATSPTRVCAKPDPQEISDFIGQNKALILEIVHECIAAGIAQEQTPS